MKSDYESWYKEDTESWIIVGGESVKPGNYYEVFKDHDYIYDNGEMVEYYYRSELYYSIRYSGGGDNEPSNVLKEEEYIKAQNIFQGLLSTIFT